MRSPTADGADKQPDDLVTSWAQYKAFASHAEKFNMTPVDVTGPGTTEPVKVHHDGGGTHGAGGGGSGGGVVGQEGQSGDAAESQGADIVNGKPRDTLDVPGRAHSAMSNISRTVSETVSGNSSDDEGKSQAQKDAIQEERKQSQPNEAFHDWEREEMEELLGELRGHLGMSNPQVRWVELIAQWCTLPDLWRPKTRPTTSCST